MFLLPCVPLKKALALFDLPFLTSEHKCVPSSSKQPSCRNSAEIVFVPHGDGTMMLLSAASLGVPVSQPVPQCTARVPPSYGFTPQNHVKLDALQVQTGMTAPDYMLRTLNSTNATSLSSLLASRPVFMQFGSYT